jgi:hypothetical protein
MNTDPSQKLIYDYYDTTLYLNQFEKNPEKGGYIKLPFTHSKSIIQPNLIHSPSQDKYYTENLYLFRKSKNSAIEGVDYDGELLIEHSPITNGSEKVYTRIPLKTQTNIDETNDLDKIIYESLNSAHLLSKIVLNLNDLLIHSHSCLVNQNHSVFIFREPILVHSLLNAFSDTAIDAYVSSYHKEDWVSIQVLSPQKPEMEENSINVEGFSDKKDKKDNKDNKDNKDKKKKGTGKPPLNLYKNGTPTRQTTTTMDIGNNLYIECNPTGASEETIEMYNLPVNGAISSNLGSLSAMTTTLNFFVFAIMTGLAVLVSPYLYKNFIIPFITLSEIDEKVRPENLRGLDVVLFFFIGCFTIGLSVLGMNTKNSTGTSMGVVLFIYFALSVGVIYALKTLNPMDYSLGENVKKYHFEILMILFNFMRENLGQVVSVAFTLLLLYFLIYSMSSYKTFFSSGSKGSQTRSGFWYGFVFIAIASIFISYSLYRINP